MLRSGRTYSHLPCLPKHNDTPGESQETTNPKSESESDSDSDPDSVSVSDSVRHHKSSYTMPDRRFYDGSDHRLLGHAQRDDDPAGRRVNNSHRHDPLRGLSSDSVSRRNSMAIRDMLNPSVEASLDSRSLSYEQSTDDEAVPSMASLTTVSPVLNGPVEQARSNTAASRRRRSMSSCNGGDKSSRFEGPARTRAFRPTYGYEQVMFLWFHDIDLNMRWDDVVNLFKAMWPGDPREKGGMQCKLYRVLEQYNIPKKRQQLLGPDGNRRAYGMWARQGHRYPWMDQYAHLLPGQSIAKSHMPGSRTNANTVYGPPGPPYHQSHS